MQDLMVFMVMEFRCHQHERLWSLSILGSDIQTPTDSINYGVPTDCTRLSDTVCEVALPLQYQAVYLHIGVMLVHYLLEFLFPCISALVQQQ